MPLADSIPMLRAHGRHNSHSGDGLDVMIVYEIVDYTKGNEHERRYGRRDAAHAPYVQLLA